MFRFTAITFLSIFLMSSCIVSKKQFDELLTEKVKLEGTLNDLSAKINKLEADINSLETNITNTNSDKDKIEQELTEKRASLSDLQAEHDQLQGYYDNAVNNSSRLNRDIGEQHNRLMALQKTLEQTEYDNNLLADSLNERAERVSALENVLAETQKAIHELEATVTRALKDFGTNELTIEEKNGRIYVSLSEQLLFKSGSAVVDPKGKNALAQLAKAIKNADGINILVEGHTDNVPLSRKSKYMEDNWDLSVMRATSIVKILEQNGVQPSSLTAAGRGEHLPVTDNSTPLNKQINRRTEIILTPDLSALFKVLSK